MELSEKNLSRKIRERIKDLTLIQKSSSDNKNLLHRIDELKSLLDVLRIYMTFDGALVEKVTDLDGSLWLGQVVTDTGQKIYHTFDHNGVCISPGLSNKERFDLSIDGYGA